MKLDHLLHLLMSGFIYYYPVIFSVWTLMAMGDEIYIFILLLSERITYYSKQVTCTCMSKWNNDDLLSHQWLLDLHRNSGQVKKKIFCFNSAKIYHKSLSFMYSIRTFCKLCNKMPQKNWLRQKVFYCTWRNSLYMHSLCIHVYKRLWHVRLKKHKKNTIFKLSKAYHKILQM